MKIWVVNFKISSKEFSSSVNKPYLFNLRIKGGVSNNLFGSLGSKVNKVRAAYTEALISTELHEESQGCLTFLTLESMYWTLQISRLHRKPYSPHNFNSWSRRSFSKGLRTVRYVLRSIGQEQRTIRPMNEEVEKKRGRRNRNKFQSNQREDKTSGSEWERRAQIGEGGRRYLRLVLNETCGIF